MSFAVIDIIGNIFFMNPPPSESNFLIICDENCIIPELLSAKVLSSFRIQEFNLEGKYYIRISSDLYRGIIISQLFSKFPRSKLYTSRREHFGSLIPSGYIEDIPSFSTKSSRAGGLGSPSKENSDFDIIYSASLTKYAETMLIDRFIRAPKEKSARAQAKNIVDGIIISHSRKNPKGPYIDSENVVNEIFNDLENHGAISINLGTIDYDDGIIETYFGRTKSRIFKPAHRNPSNFEERKMFVPQFYEYNPGREENLYNMRPEPNIEMSSGFRLDAESFNIIGAIDPEPERNVFQEDESEKIQQIIEKAIDIIFLELDDVKNVLTLYRMAIRVVRDCVENYSIVISEDSRSKAVKSIMKLVLEMYFVIENDISSEDAAENLSRYSLVKLTKRE